MECGELVVTVGPPSWGVETDAAPVTPREARSVDDDETRFGLESTAAPISIARSGDFPRAIGNVSVASRAVC